MKTVLASKDAGSLPEESSVENFWRARVLVPLLAVYLIWGSTYLAIRVALETMPPFAMAGVRYLIAGAILYGGLRLSGAAGRPHLSEWKQANILGALMLLVGNGGVVYAEETIPSGVAALLVGMVPLITAILEWIQSGQRPKGRKLFGLALGLTGTSMLVLGGSTGNRSTIDPKGVLAILAACLTWVWGTFLSRRSAPPRSPHLHTAMQMLTGGAQLLIVGLLTGEASRIHLAGMTTRSLTALAYLVIFGSLVAFSAYTFLVRTAPPSVVVTYAYVNPMIAVLLGWALGQEPITPVLALSCGAIVVAVALIVRGESKPARR
jgi:drug/metabolite transporter (DMT)-like permease